ncbi:uncharacterized protein BDZ99DRAFT_526956 [Mytilinidion resinicola]|uniref:Uncharacterized protein n=1 Tax=Mytilinidion resinicola TaxID=574789 RepID=A0A6A6Y2U8_9PEZI|nr:uncharacterized protein BDZ99DRAFT_526956 [Mytilinidion resinicola]KAF2802848.1 hypothetical protein BDZ99DRAFT_526956 [Mytilinidion resinicola]
MDCHSASDLSAVGTNSGPPGAPRFYCPKSSRGYKAVETLNAPPGAQVVGGECGFGETNANTFLARTRQHLQLQKDENTKLQKRLESLELENTTLKKRLEELRARKELCSAQGTKVEAAMSQNKEPLKDENAEPQERLISLESRDPKHQKRLEPKNYLHDERIIQGGMGRMGPVGKEEGAQVPTWDVFHNLDHCKMGQGS